MWCSKVADEDAHMADVVALLHYDGLLYSGAEDGHIKIWSEDLKLKKDIVAHPVNVYALAIAPPNESNKSPTLYSSSNDGTIKAWCGKTGDFKTDLINYDNEVEVLYVYKGTLYAGDDKGSVGVFKNEKLKLIYSLLEEIKGLIVCDNLMFTVRDLDVVVTEFLSDESTRYMTRETLCGKSPICLAGDKLCFASRCGKNILCHENNKDNHFKKLDEAEAHSMIINTMCSRLNSDGSVTLATGGWDKTVKIWNINTDGKISLSKSIDCNVCVNSVCFGSNDKIFIAGNDGFICQANI